MGCHHHHDHSQIKNKKILFIAFLLTLSFAVFEIFSALLFNTLALLSEGIHMLSDGFSLGLSLVAVILGMKAVTTKKTFGYRRIETIAAFLNGLALLVVPIYVVFESIQRFLNPEEIMSKKMLIVAIIGLIINCIVAFVLSRGNSEENLNIRAASLHVISDLLSSVAAIIASLCIMFFDWHFADPLVSFIVSIVIFLGGIHITKESFNVLMEGTPEDVDFEGVKKDILLIDDVQTIKHLRIWSIASGENYLNVHIEIPNKANEQKILTAIKFISEKYHLHETIQIEKA